MVKNKKHITKNRVRKVKRLAVFAVVIGVFIAGMNVYVKIYNKNKLNNSDIKNITQILPTDDNSNIPTDENGNIIYSPATSQEIEYVKNALINKLMSDAQNKLGIENVEIENVFGYFKILNHDNTLDTKESQMSIIVKANGEIKSFIYDDSACELKIEGDTSIDVLSSLYAKISACSPVELQQMEDSQQAICINDDKICFVSKDYDYVEKNGRTSTAIDIYKIDSKNTLQRTQHRLDKMLLANNELTIYEAMAMYHAEVGNLFPTASSEILTDNQKTIQNMLNPNVAIIVQPVQEY